MPIEIQMPRLTDSMTEGVVVAWRKREGEPVRAGEVIAEIQADKTTVDFEAPEDGTLCKIVTPAGAEPVKVGDVLALLQRPGEPAPGTVDDVKAAAGAFTGNGDSRPREDVEPLSAAATPGVPEVGPTIAVALRDVDASPMVRSMAAQAGVDLSRLGRNGPRARITMADILTELALEPRQEIPSPSAVAAPASPEPSQSDAPYDEVSHSRMRLIIARRLSDSKQMIPHFYLTSHCEIDALLQLKAELQTRVKAELKLSINDFLIRAAALALRAVPEANATWTGTATRRYRRVDVAVAVATDAGLLTPVIRDAGRKGLAEIATEVRDLAARARSGRLRPEEYEGGTFTISNLGMYDVDEICAIINPPQAAILGIGTAGERPVVRDGAVVVATMLTCTLSADHRVLDGAAAAKLLSTFKSLVEQPTTMIL